MNNIYGINGYGGPHPIQPQRSTSTGTPQDATAPDKKTDQVEISQIARYLQKIATMPDIRAEKVENVKKALTEGTYDLGQKQSVAIDRFLQEYGLE